MKRLLTWLLPLLTSLVTVAFFFLMSVRSTVLAHPILAAAIAISLNVFAVVLFGLVAAGREHRS